VEVGGQLQDPATLTIKKGPGTHFIILGGIQSQFGFGGEEKESMVLQESNPILSARSSVTIQSYSPTKRG